MAERYMEIFTETKCRRCGTLHEWQFVSGNQYSEHTRLSFIDQINAKINEADSDWCRKCNKNTIQDLVSYEIKHEEDEDES